jgi:hypothetical protein
LDFHPSSKRAVFEDKPWIFGHPSSKRAVFEDKPGIFCLSSSFSPRFEDELEFRPSYPQKGLFLRTDLGVSAILSSKKAVFLG